MEKKYKHTEAFTLSTSIYILIFIETFIHMIEIYASKYWNRQKLSLQLSEIRNQNNFQTSEGIGCRQATYSYDKEAVTSAQRQKKEIETSYL